MEPSSQSSLGHVLLRHDADQHVGEIQLAAEEVVSRKAQNLLISLYPSLPSEVDLQGGGASAGVSFFPPFDDRSFAAIPAYVGLLDMVIVYMEYIAVHKEVTIDLPRL